MMFYTTVAGWLLLYFVKMAKGDFTDWVLWVSNNYASLMQEPGLMTIFMVINSAAVYAGLLPEAFRRGQRRSTRL